MKKKGMIALLSEFAMLDVTSMPSALEKAFSSLPATNHSHPHLFHLKIREKAPIKIVLSGHADTVLPPRPLQQKDNRLYGSGVLDMKGGLVILLYALLAFEKEKLTERIGFEILINFDEESGSTLSTPFLKEAAKGAKLALVFEPALPSGNIISRRKGSYNYKVIARGKKAHVGRNPEQGKNAIYPLARFISEIENPEIHVGVISGGIAPNVVPDFATCDINVRAFSLDELQSLEETILKKAATLGLTVETKGKRAPKNFDAQTEKYFLQLQKCAERLSIHLEWEESGGVTDGNTFASMGIPTIDTLGPIGNGMHTEVEFIEIDSLEKRQKLVTVFLLSLEKQEN